MNILTLNLVILLCLVCCTGAYKILVVYALPITSINFLGQSIVKELLKDGHQVTYITTHPMSIPEGDHFRQIDVSESRVLIENPNDTTWSISTILANKITQERQGIQDFAKLITEMTYANENITNFIQNDNEHFDAVIADWMESELPAGFAVLYNCPMMWFFSIGANWQVLQLIGEISSPAYDTDYYGSNTPPFNFIQRVQELYSRIGWSQHKMFHLKPFERNLYEQLFGPPLARRGRTLPDFDEVIYNASMVFGNDHHAIIGRPSTPQNYKSIGGIHVADPVKPLPKDLQELMDNASHGVIYFSMGSFFKAKQLPMTFVREILDVFGELQQTVIWKYEADLKDVPKNVRIVKWAPQQSILAHPNCKFFISHGGCLSTIETIHFGVPIIGVPVLLDQITNINRAAKTGFAIQLKLDYDLPKNLRPAIQSMLTDDSYGKTAKELSSIYHDRPMKPGQEFLFWMHHVMKTRGARHLRSPAVDVPLYQRMYLDLAAVVTVIISIVIYIIYILFKSIKGTKQSIKKKNQ